MRITGQVEVQGEYECEGEVSICGCGCGGLPAVVAVEGAVLLGVAGPALPPRLLPPLALPAAHGGAGEPDILTSVLALRQLPPWVCFIQTCQN